MSYQSRINEEHTTGRPALPCIHCGFDDWHMGPVYQKDSRPQTRLATCGHCHIVEDAHHVDGEWLGAWLYAELPIPLYDFAEEHARILRERRE